MVSRSLWVSSLVVVGSIVMVRRIVLGLVVVGVFGAYANADPTVWIESADGLYNGQFNDNGGVPYTMIVSVSGMDTATTDLGVNPSSLVGVSLTFEVDGDDSGKEALSYSNYVPTYLTGGIPLPDNDPLPTGTRDAVNLGDYALVFAAPAALGAAKTELGRFDVTITGGTEFNSFLAIIAQGENDAKTNTSPQPLLVSNLGNPPSDTVNNWSLAGLSVEVAGLPLVPEPATLIMLGFGGLAVLRRRRSGKN